MRTNSTRGQESRRRRSRLRMVVTAVQTVILLVMGAGVGVTLGLFISLSRMIPKVGDLRPPEATIIYSSDGVQLGRVYVEDRTNVPLDDIPKVLTDATIAIEDSRFYKHSGVDVRGIARATWENVRGQRLSQGGSTITQQLARNVYLSPQRTMQRKAQEAILAVMMEQHFTKDRILELYLNQIYYGSGAYGVQAASKVYFGKNVGGLNLSEAALLAGLPRAPSYYCPHTNLRLALDRRDVVLNRLAELGYITPQQRDDAKVQRINIIPRQTGRNVYKAPHFVDYVTQQLRERYGNKTVAEGGLRVYTTLNYEMQKAAEKALREGVKKHESRRRVTEGCLVSIEPANGYVRAMVGSVDPKSQFNRCTQAGRQPGSSFKLFVYSAAFEAGMSSNDRVNDTHVEYPNGSGGKWRPRNYDGRWHGWVTIKRAIANSINIPAIKTADKVGINNVIKYAKAMGITADLEPYLPLAIGGIKGVHPIDMASAYGTIANNGIHVDPCSIIKVTNSRGEVIDDFIPEGEQVLAERTVKMMDECLRAVVTQGTGRSVRWLANARGKTGTTNDDRDAWWIGYVPQKLVTAVWVGNDNYTPMRSAWGGTVCAPIWGEFMRTAISVYDHTHANKIAKAKKGDHSDHSKPKEQKPEEATAQDGTKPDVKATDDDTQQTVTRRICDETDLLATDNCPSTHAQQFARGSEPATYCTAHGGHKPADQPDSTTSTDANATMVTVTICPDSGMLAGANCSRPLRKRMPVDSVPTQFCTIHSRSGGR